MLVVDHFHSTSSRTLLPSVLDVRHLSREALVRAIRPFWLKKNIKRNF